MWKVALVFQNVQILKKFTEGNARKFTVNFAFFDYADVMTIRKKLRFYVSARRLLQLASSARVQLQNYREPP